jgi:signal transduction histidine kinase
LSIRLRLTIYWSATTALILFVAGLLIFAMFQRAMLGSLDAALMEEADTTAAAISRSGPDETKEILQRLTRERDLGPGRRIRLEVGGRSVFDAGDDTADLPRRTEPGANRIADGTLHRYRYAIVRLRFQGADAALIDGTDARPVRGAISRLRDALLLAIPVILALSIVGGYWMATRALTPLNEISDDLARIEPRDLTSRLPASNSKDEAHRLISAINQLLERLESASAAQRRFVSEAAHELRTPLAVLRSGLEVTLQRPRTIEESRAALDQAAAEVERLCTMAEDLLALARLNAEPMVERAPADLSAIATETSTIARTLAEPRMQELTVTAPAGIIVNGSAADLRRVLLNLLDNAVKYTPERGRIEVVVTADGPVAMVSVRDDGPGIDPRDLDHVFEPFYRGRSVNGAGGGLGLALSREIVDRHGGTIEAANRAEGGCEIRFRLPLSTGPRTPART